MAGHSQFANIKHRKDAQDKKKAKLFTKLQREIFIAAKSGISDPEVNSKLKTAIAKARQLNMTKDVIEKAIKKASGDLEKSSFQDLTYNISSGSAAIVVECSTDSKNRTLSDLKVVLSKFNVNLVETGSLDFMFDKIGQIVYENLNLTEDKMLEIVINSGAVNMNYEDGVAIVDTEQENLHAVEKIVTKELKIEPTSVANVYRPKNLVELEKEKLDMINNFLDKLEDLDDVVEIYHNLV